MFDLTNNILNIERAEYELNKAYKSNPTAWGRTFKICGESLQNNCRKMRKFGRRKSLHLWTFA